MCHRTICRIGLGRRDQVGDRFDRGLGIDHDDIERARHQRDGCKILVRIVRQFGVQAWIDRIGERAHQQRIAVGVADRDGLGSDDGPCPRLVLDHDVDAEIFGHLLRQGPRDHVGAAARRKGHDDLDDPVRIGGRTPCLMASTCNANAASANSANGISSFDRTIILRDPSFLRRNAIVVVLLRSVFEAGFLRPCTGRRTVMTPPTARQDGQDVP